MTGAGLLRGVLPVLLTPFTDDGEIDADGFARTARHVAATGVPGAMFPGYASEFYRLSDAERDTLARILIEAAADGPMATIVSVTEQATLLAARRAAQWAEAGASAINVLAPTIVPADAGATIAHLGAVLKAAAPAPVIVQHAPALTGSPMRLGQLRRLADEHANLVAVKVETLPAGPAITELAEGSPALPSLVGYGGLHLVDALRRGTAGVQPGCSFTEVYQRIWGLWQDGDEAAAEALHTRLLPYLTYWMQDVQLIVRAEKVIAHRRGLIQSDHCRAPARNLDRPEREAIERFLTEFADLLTPGPLP
jgi:dihydrodipicolinate synthase/N-acetylneuraminate lyase